MKINREIGHAPRTVTISKDLMMLNGPCIGCENCRGMCMELIEAMVVPDMILSAAKD